MDHDRIQRLTRQREVEWQQLQSYIDEPGCLMRFLAQALDDPDARPCGRCAQCLGRPLVSVGFSSSLAIQAMRSLRHADLPLECKKQVSPGAFTESGFKGRLPAELRAETGRVLSRWGDAGWGRMVAEDKHVGRFRDELVDAVAELIQQRWRPEPQPAWVTCVPSHRHPELVPNFAQRLAARLGLPFVAAVSKVRDNEPQKRQENRYHRCRNLDGVFAIEPEIPAEPVLLVDDIVDSAWTLTVVAALLRQAGSGPVWPVALATSSVGD
jgi:ATP-dependent DNA helicase RecQ